MTRNDRRRSKQWHFSDSGNRFDRRRNLRPVTDPHPISKSFTRKIIHCKRCGSRVVSNVNHCPYCGKSLLPLFKRFWFWLLIVVLVGATTGGLVFFTPATELSQKPPEMPAPAVVGASEGTSTKNLAFGTIVDCNSLLVTVISSSQEMVASDGLPITAVKVQFLNKSSSDVTLYLTQWQLETTSGERVEHYIGKTAGGETVTSELDSRNLPKDATVTATLYFAANDPLRVIFAPNALSENDTNLVTWSLPAPAPAAEAEGAPPAEG
jgi:RNA polymerase subunit RPABC4/transcription elongation factor Spt4